MKTFCSFATFFLLVTCFAYAQRSSPAPELTPNRIGPDKALITKAKSDEVMNGAALSALAKDYYDWRNQTSPVFSSDAGLHTWDNKLTDYSPAAMTERSRHLRSVLDRVRAMKTDGWPKDQRIDWLLFRSQLEQSEFGDRVRQSQRRQPAV